jgi:pimeloyl-ACP methyl ester carboxylesterase
MSPAPILYRLLCAIILLLPGSATVQAAAEFKPVFFAIHCPENVNPVGVKWDHPVYNLTGWKRADGQVAHNPFDLGEVLLLKHPKVSRTGETTQWEFSHEAIHLVAQLTAGRLSYTFTVKRPGQWTVAYAGAPAAALSEVVELFQPLVWNGRRLPESCFLIPDEICSIPGCLVETQRGTVGVMADPSQFPYAMPHGRNRRFGVTVRNREGQAQPLVFLPFPGSPEAAFGTGDSRSYRLVLIDDARPLAKAFESVARDVCGFRDRRENTLNSLNQAFENILDFATSPAGQFDAANRAFSYPDSAGTVKNVSALHPLSLAIVTDSEPLFRGQGIPLLEFLLSREKFLFALSRDTRGSQGPSRRLAGPAMPVSELAALHRLSHGATPHFLSAAERLEKTHRTLNMDWVSPAGSWQNDLWLYRAAGDPTRLTAATSKADLAIASRLDCQPTDFREAGTGTFFDYMLPPWKEFYELWLETREPRHLAAAHKAARQYAQMIWFYPAVPEGNVEVNPAGFAPRRGRPGEPGLVPAPRETVPAWRVSEQGLLCEGNGTVSRLAIYLATHAPLFMRLSHDAADPFLHDIARSAMVGRFAGFPGYHFNTEYSTAQEKPNFAQHPFEQLKHTTSMHYNHSLPMAALVLDYLFSDAYARSCGAIDFPAEYAEGYAYLGGRVYGAPGRFYDVGPVRPWMPKGLVTTDNIQVNYVAARADAGLCLALLNQCNRPLEDVSVCLDLTRFEAATGAVEAEVWHDGKKLPSSIPVEKGRLRVSLAPHGLTALCIRGLVPRPVFQQKLHTRRVAGAAPTDAAVVTPSGTAHVLRLSFGKELTWHYAYLDCKEDDVKQVVLTVESPGGSTPFTDTAYPFEFSVPQKESGGPVQFRFELRGEAGVIHAAAPVSFPDAFSRAVEDQELIRSKGRLAEVRNRGPNPYLEGFPTPQPFHEKYRPALIRNADGLLVKAESEHARAEAGVAAFLTNNFLPAVRKTLPLGEAELTGIRIAARPSDAQLNVLENVAYNKLGERALLLDLYTPKTASVTRLPVVLFVHGGGWLDGTHRSNRPVAMSLAERGFACIAVEYRLGREACFPAAVWDVKAAVRWVRKNAERYHLNESSITVAGGSAGGNIAGLVGVTNGDPRFEGDGEHREFSSDVSGVIALDGAVGEVSGNWAASPQKDPWLYNEAIPLFHMLKQQRCLPLLFVKGGAPLSNWIQSEIPGARSQHVHFRWPHAFECFDPSKDELVDILAKHLRSAAWAQSTSPASTPVP